MLKSAASIPLLLTSALALSVSGPALAQDEDSAGSKISGSFGIDYASHFISYGLDVWGAGDDFYGSNATNFAHFGVGIQFTDNLSGSFGVWGDINDNAPPSIGGHIQEIDVFGGLSYTAGVATLGATYQQWNYAGDVERILDLSVGLDDSGLWGGDFALNPSVLAHLRVGANEAAGQEEANAYVVSIAPGFQLLDSPTWPVSLTIPASVAFFEEDFQGGDSGYGYGSLGATTSLGLGGIPADYGEWSLAFNLTYYDTPEDAIPGNPEDAFLTGMVSIGVSY